MKKLSILLLFLFLGCSIYAQEQNTNSLISLWNSMPDSLCSLKSEAKTDTFTTKLNYLKINVSSASTLQLATYETIDKKNIICLIRTYQAPAAESNVSFYDMNWNRVGNQSFDFYSFSSDSTIQDYFVPTLISACINNDKTLTICLSDQNLSDEEKKIINFPLTKKLIWNGKRFE